MFTALASLLTGRKVRADVAMTGEISLRGLVLPVGGIKQKVVAAHAAGIKRVLLPARNKRDYEEIPEGARQGLEFVWCEQVDDALAGALEEEPAPVRATGGLTDAVARDDGLTAPPATMDPWRVSRAGCVNRCSGTTLAGAFPAGANDGAKLHQRLASPKIGASPWPSRSRLMIGSSMSSSSLGSPA